MLPARNRMTRSAEFGDTVKCGVRAAQPDLVVHACRPCDHSAADGSEPHVGFIVAKSVGNAVVRHRVTRRLRHIVSDLTGDLKPGEHVVVRALPGSRNAPSVVLREQVAAALRRAHRVMDREPR